MSVLPLCQWNQEECIGFPGIGVTEGCKPPYGGWELNLGPLKSSQCT